MTLLGLVFQMALTAGKDWRRISGFERVPEVIAGVKFQDGIMVVDPDEGDPNYQQQIAA